MTTPTKKYLFLHRSQAGQSAPSPDQKPSPEQMQTMMTKWNAWKEKFKDNIVDWGDKLKPGGKIVSGSSVSDGPFVEAKEIIGGFMIVAVENIEAAIAMAQEIGRASWRERVWAAVVGGCVKKTKWCKTQVVGE